MIKEILLYNELLEAILKELKEIKMALVKREREFLTLAEASEYLKLSNHTLYSYVKKRLLPCFKVQNHKLYFRISDLDDFILNDGNRIASEAEIQEEAAAHDLMSELK